MSDELERELERGEDILPQFTEKFYRTPNGEPVEIVPEKLPDGTCAPVQVRTAKKEGHHGVAVQGARARVIRRTV